MTMAKQVKYREVQAKSALHKLKRKVPYGWDLNIYRGCEHACRYCYALYSHKYMNSTDYFGEIFVKTNIIDLLERELMSQEWKGEVINIGGVTDSYQPAEAHYRLMPEILKLLIKYKTPAIISTKSCLVLRDYDLIDKLSKITYINIAATVTVMDESIRSKIEPGSAESKDRFEVLKAFRKTNASIGLHVMPIIPLITDTEDNFESMFALARSCNVDYVLPGTLYLRGHTRSHFFHFLQHRYPDLVGNYRELYKTGGASKEYKAGLYNMVNRLRGKYRLSSSYMKPMRARLP
jgi:DNA repair photolyase